MSPYDYDIRLESRHAATIAAILGRQFFVRDVEMDRKQATDFVVFTVRPFKVAARLRTHYYLERYPREFTIRWSRPSGVDTEIDKIRAGLVDYMIYGFVSEDEERIVQYFIGDLDIFRVAEPEPLCVKPNRPPDSELAAYSLLDLPSAFVVKSWPDAWAHPATDWNGRGAQLRLEASS